MSSTVTSRSHPMSIWIGNCLRVSLICPKKRNTTTSALLTYHRPWCQRTCPLSAYSRTTSLARRLRWRSLAERTPNSEMRNIRGRINAKKQNTKIPGDAILQSRGIPIPMHPHVRMFYGRLLGMLRSVFLPKYA